MTNFLRILVCLCFALLIEPYSMGQSRNFDFREMPEDNRISQSHILSIYQDSEGFIWIGTYNGLYRFDGYSILRYNENLFGNAEIFDFGVHAIFEDDSSQLWIGTENGLSVINKITGNIKHFLNDNDDPTSIGHNSIKTIEKTLSGDILVGTYGGGISVYDREKNNFTTYRNDPSDSTSISSNLINTIFIDREGTIWIGTEGGGMNIFNIEEKTFSHFKSKSGDYYPDLIVNAFIEDNEGNIWIGTWYKGAFKYNKTQNTFAEFSTHSQKSKTISNNTVRDIAKDNDGNIWLVTYGGGVNIYDGKEDIVYTVNQKKTNVSDASQMFLWTAFTDESGIIWIGTFGSGVFTYSKNKLNIKDLVADEAINKVIKNLRITSLIEDSKGNIWFGTLGKGVFLLDPSYSKLNHLIDRPEMSSNIVRSIFEDRSGKIWIGTDGGLFKISADQKEIAFYANEVNNPKSISNNGIYTIYEDKKGNIWIGLWGKGVNLLRKEEINKTIENASFEKLNLNNLSECNVWAIEENKNGNMFFGTNKGLEMYNPSDSTLEHICSFDISSLFWDNNGNLWVSTFGNGVHIYNQAMICTEILNSDNGLVTNIEYSFFNDSKNNIWVVTNKGLTRLSLGMKMIQNYSMKKDVELTKVGRKALQKTKNGLAIVAGEGGIKVFNPDLVFEDLSSDPLYITDIKLFNKSIRDMDKKFTDFPSLKELSLTYKQNFISIEFAALNYSEPEKTKYAYKLEGFDKDWVYTDAANRTATYKNLGGGKYNFIVRSLNINGMWAKNEISLKISITPPFWRTLLFKISVGILVLLLLFIFIMSREKRIHKDYYLKEELLKSEKLLFENEELKRQISQFNEKLEEKKNELTSSAIQIVSKNQALSAIRSEINSLMPQALMVTKRKLEKVVFHINQNLNDKSDWERLNLNLNLIQDNFITRFAEHYPQITHKDLKICGYIRMNLPNEEIAELLNISGRSLEMCRYRIRRKIGIDKKTQLNDFILRF